MEKPADPATPFAEVYQSIPRVHGRANGVDVVHAATRTRITRTGTDRVANSGRWSLATAAGRAHPTSMSTRRNAWVAATLAALAAGATAAVGGSLVRRYRRDLQAARSRLSATVTTRIATGFR